MVFIRDALPAGVLEACEFIFADFHWEIAALIPRLHTFRTAKRLQLFEGKFDWLFFLTRDELIALNDSSTGIPTQDCVVLTWGANRFGSFEPAHRLTQKVVGLKPTSRGVLPQFHLRAALRHDSGIIRA